MRVCGNFRARISKLCYLFFVSLVGYLLRTLLDTFRGVCFYFFVSFFVLLSFFDFFAVLLVGPRPLRLMTRDDDSKFLREGLGRSIAEASQYVRRRRGE